jgi:hypothetical protein
MINSFLMIGQSNMAGRGLLQDVKPIVDEQIKVLINGRWQTMWEPINPDRPSSGISLAASFAAAHRLSYPDVEVGLIACADGGSSLAEWAEGGELFVHAISKAKLAMQTSELKAILWHQGENDSFNGLSKTYENRLGSLEQAFRQELGCTDLPFIVGGLGDFLAGGRYGKYFTEYQAVNEALREFVSSRPNCHYVTEAGLTANQDDLHFDAASLRKFGIRYFEAYRKQGSVLQPLRFEDDLLETINARQLTNKEKTWVLEVKFAKGEISLLELEQGLQILKN